MLLVWLHYSVFKCIRSKREDSEWLRFLRVYLRVECAVVLRCTRPERAHGQREDRPSPEQAEAAPPRGRVPQGGGGGRRSHDGGRTAVSRSLSGPFVLYLKGRVAFWKSCVCPQLADSSSFPQEQFASTKHPGQERRFFFMTPGHNRFPQ